MHIRYLLLIIFISLGVFQYNLFAQEIVPAAGGESVLSGGSISYSVGQVVYNNYFGTSGSLTEGVQQAYEISTVTGMHQYGDINLYISVYPNPVTDYLILETNNFDNSNFTFHLYSVDGKLLMSKKVDGNETNISLGTLRSAVYYLKVYNNREEIKTFKIVKY